MRSRRGPSLGVARVVGGQGQPQLAVREHVRAVGERDRPLRALLDEQDREAALADRGERLEDGVLTIGASPSEGSSSSSTSGAATSARAIASCCCWPPESAPACACELRRIGNSSGRGRRRRPRLLRPPAGEAQPQVLLDGELGEDAPPLRDERDTAARDASGGRPARSAAELDRRPRGGTSPVTAWSVSTCRRRSGRSGPRSRRRRPRA